MTRISRTQIASPQQIRPRPRAQLTGLALLLLLAPLAPLGAAEQDPPALDPATDVDGGAGVGKVTGGKMLTHPDWFKDSFLDLADDVAEAAGEDRHVILVMEMNGCPYCYKMVQDNFANSPDQSFIREHFDVIALNTKGDREVAVSPEMSVTEKELAEIYSVAFTPTLIFLDQDNNPVARVSGYRNPQDFRLVLDYVQGKAYRDQTLAAYLDAQRTGTSYSFRAHPQLEETDDLSRMSDKPIALLFEDAACRACDALHDGHLADPQIRAALEPFHFVRLDAGSESPLVDPMGNQTTPKALAETLGLHYRPSLVLFDGGREIARIESMLYRYHFGGILEYVGAGHYRDYPDSPFDYIDAKTAELTAAGQDVAISDE